jgi:hypothetical protein
VDSDGGHFSGRAATQLQIAARTHHRRDLGVFRHTNNIKTWNEGRNSQVTRWQWIPNTGSWDPVFECVEDDMAYYVGHLDAPDLGDP